MAKYPEIPEYDKDLQFGTLDEAINVYVATRDDLATERKQFNAYESHAKAYMDRIQMFIRDKADQLGMDSIRTPSGTAYRSVKTSYRVTDWPAYVAWLQETGNFHCLEKRAAKLAVKEVHDETGEVPPGLSYVAEVEFDVRRPSR